MNYQSKWLSRGRAIKQVRCSSRYSVLTQKRYLLRMNSGHLNFDRQEKKQITQLLPFCCNQQYSDTNLKVSEI